MLAARDSQFDSPDNGVVGGYEGGNMNITRAMMSFTAIAWYNCAEIIILVFVVFKRYSGAYFWSLLVTAISIIIYSLGAWGKLVSISQYILFPVTFTCWGWMGMIIGQSIVLWSRLHLITQNEKVLKGILWGILINSFFVCIPTVVLAYGSNTRFYKSYVPGYQVMERIQMTFFTVQELALSTFYLYKVRHLLRVVYEGPTRKLMWEIAVVNIAIIALDITLLSVEFIDFYEIEITLKGMVYSIKLKLEFAVLSKLVKIVGHRKGTNIDEVASNEQKTPNNTDLATLSPAHTRDSNFTYSTTPTMVNSTSTTTNSSKRSGSEGLASHFRIASSVGGGEEMMMLNKVRTNDEEMAPVPAAMQYPMAKDHFSTNHTRRGSNMTDFYPGRLM